MLSKVRIILIIAIVLMSFGIVRSQSTEFTYQGRLLSGDVPANGSYDFEFVLFDAASAGNQLGTTFPLSAVSVNNGVFSVRIDFGDQFPGANRFLEIHVRQSGGGVFSVLAPRQAISSAPYAIKSLNAANSDNAVNATQLGGVSAGQFVVTSDARLTDARNPLPNSSNYIQNSTSQQASSNFNVSGNGKVGGTLSANTVNVTSEYDINGNRFVSFPGLANTFVGFLTGLSNTTGDSNSIFGNQAGQRNTTGGANSFFGINSGNFNTTGNRNSFFGAAAGGGNTTGNSNTVVGTFAGVNTTTGSNNSFFGADSGGSNTIESNNTFLGSLANGSIGITNATAVGFKAAVTQSNSLVLGSISGVNNSGADTRVGIGITAPAKHLHVFGAGDQEIAIQSSDAGGRMWTLQSSRGTASGNFQIIDRTAGASRLAIDLNGNVGIGTTTPAEKLHVNGNALITGNLTVNGTANLPTTAQYIWNSTSQQPAGNFNIAGNGTVAGTLSGNIVTATTQFNIGANRAIRSDFSGVAIGRNSWASDGGDANTFVGQDTGFANSGSNNAFFGDSAGQGNTSGNNNTFIGNVSGLANTIGSGNSFFGNSTGGITTGSSNTLIGASSSATVSSLNFASAIGASATVSTSDTIVLGKAAGTYGGVSRQADTVIVRGLLQLPGLGAAGATTLCRNASNQISTCSSSIRYKKNINSFTSGLDLIRRLRPVSFNWKADGTADFGLVAEEVNKVEPLLTTTNEKGQVEGVKYDRVGVVLVNAVNEQQTQIEGQQKQITAQKEIIQRQQTEIDALKKLVCSRNRSAAACRSHR